MSLLNDALKAAEQRQNRSVTPAAYTGQSSAAPRHRGLAGIIAVAVLVLGAGLGGYIYLAPSASDIPAIVANTVLTDSSGLSVDATNAGERGTAISTEPASNQSIIDEQVLKPEPALAAATIEPVAGPGPAVTDGPQVSELPQAQPESTITENHEGLAEAPAQTLASVRPEKEDGPAGEPLDEAVSEGPADIKQTRQTPAQLDRDTRHKLKTLIAKGHLGTAEKTLAALAKHQSAPLSRYVLARALLVNGEPDKTLRWVPEGLVSSHPDLRLIRARALLAKHDLDAAVSALSASVPPVRSHVEYRVTLATLMQQQGRNGAAAGHWAELIAWDDSQAPWWVGLAIALEGRGDFPAARRAYAQAAALPGLAPSLADYVRQRLLTLRAG